MATDYTNPEILGLDRQRAMAQMLLKQGMETPQGQMISNRYVRASPWQFIGNLAQQYVGNKVNEQADVDQLALAKKLREQEMADINQGMQLFQGTPGQAGVPELTQQGPTQTGGNIPVQAAIPEIAATPANPQAAMARLLGSKGTRANALGSEIAKQLFREPKWEKEIRTVDGNKVTGYVNLNSPNPETTFRAGSTSPDYDYLKAVDKGLLPQKGEIVTTPQTQSGQMPVSTRNNNPGNLVGADGNFLKFATPQEGDMALTKDLLLKLSGQSPAYKSRFGNAPVTPLTLAETWSPAEAKGNSVQSTNNYSKFIAEKLGILPNQPIPNTPEALQVVKSAISQFEAGAYNVSETKTTTQGKQDPFSPYPAPHYIKSPEQQREWYAKQAEPLTGTPADKVTGAVNYQNALDNYKNIIKTFSPSDMANPNKRVALQEAYNTVILTGKDAHSLGVLNGGDERILTGLAPNLNNPSSLLVSVDAVTKAADGQKQFASNVITNQYKVHQKPIPENLRAYVITEQTKDNLPKSENVSYEFKTEAEAAKAGLKKGTRIVINGVSGTWN